MVSQGKLLLVAMFLFLSVESSLGGLAAARQADPARPWLVAGADTADFGTNQTNGFTPVNDDKNTPEAKLAGSYKYILLCFLPVLLLLFYNKVLESWVADRKIRGKCLRNSIHVRGFETLHLMIDVDSPVPTLQSDHRFMVLQSKEDSSKASLVPNYLLSKQDKDMFSTGYALSAIHDDDDGVLELGDILIAIDCSPIVVPQGMKSQDHLTKTLENRSSNRWYELRMPLVLTVLRPVRGDNLCPPFAYLTADEKHPVCCVKVDDKCEKEEWQVPNTSLERFKESLQSKVLTELWVAKYPTAIKDAGREGVELKNDPFTRGKLWTPSRREGFFGKTWFVFLKHSVIGLSAIGLTAFLLYVPLHQPDSDYLRNGMFYAITATALVCVIGYFGITIFNSAHGESAALRKTNMIYVTFLAWLTVVMLPGVVFVMYRPRAENSDHRHQTQFAVVTGFVGFSFSLLYLMHVVLQLGKTRLHLDVPALLSQHMSELVLGIGAFLDSFIGFRELSRSLYANGGACSLANLNSELVKIKRNNKPVKWACEGNTEETLAIDVADGTTCNVMCSPQLVKPVTCYDYGLIGGEWTIIELNLTDRFCCHPFVCDSDTHTYNATLCGLDSDGCVPK